MVNRIDVAAALYVAFPRCIALFVCAFSEQFSFGKISRTCTYKGFATHSCLSNPSQSRRIILLPFRTLQSNVYKHPFGWEGKEFNDRSHHKVLVRVKEYTETMFTVLVSLAYR